MSGKHVVVQKPIDQRSKAEQEAALAQSLALIEQAKALWPGLVRKSEEERKNSPGRALGVFVGPLGLLFGILVPKNGVTPPIAKAFDVLGEQDDGVDPEHFEAELLDRRLHRAVCEQKIVDALDDFSRHMADDVLDVSEKVVGPGLLALQLARVVAKASKDHASTLAPVLDGFRALTKKARKKLDERRAAKPAPGAKAEPEAEPKPADE